ncbi:MAG: alpha/beta hydrolase [Deltaproteobacteria bacterium]|nr:alpha/beta hydrolase [Deltaproteobacteria bacterium]
MTSSPAKPLQLLRVTLLLAALYLAYCLAMSALQRYLLYPGARRFNNLAAVLPSGAQPLYRQLEQGRVEAWLLPALGMAENRRAPLVVFAHGNGEVIDQWPSTLEPLRRLGVALLLVEYRGFGRSAGTPSQSAIVEDFRYFVERVSQRADIDGERRVFFGRSLGGGVVCALSRLITPRALILSSTFTSIADAARRFLLPRFLVKDPYDNIAALRVFDGPTLILHGRADRLLPFNNAEKLVATARQGELVPFAGGHNTSPDSGYFRAVANFLRRNRIID